MTEHIKHYQNKNNTINKHSNKSYNINKEKFNNLKEHISNNHRQLKTYPHHFTYDTIIKELEEFRNSTDYEAMREIAIDKWTRN